MTDVCRHTSSGSATRNTHTQHSNLYLAKSQSFCAGLRPWCTRWSDECALDRLQRLTVLLGKGPQGENDKTQKLRHVYDVGSTDAQRRASTKSQWGEGAWKTQAKTRRVPAKALLPGMPCHVSIALWALLPCCIVQGAPKATLVLCTCTL
eukprot:6017255-Amphidinium_carterae.1